MPLCMAGVIMPGRILGILIAIIVIPGEPTVSQILGADEAIIFTLSGKRALHTVSDKFLGVSVDPAVLLAGLNLSDASLRLAQGLGPAYIRIAGPSTHFIKYQDVGDSVGNAGNLGRGNENEAMVVTPPMWFGINEWLALANLTPVFGLNVGETSDTGKWNPKPTMPLLELSDKFNVTCLWQLGFDCSNQTLALYKENLGILRGVLDAFEDKKNRWRVIASDMTLCGTSGSRKESGRKLLEDLDGVIGAAMWESNSDDSTFSSLLSSPLKPKIPIWKTAPKSAQHVSFTSALTWAKQVGDAAKMGCEVIFRQPRLHELFSDTPAYWVSVLHKRLMGQTVLDIKDNAASANSHVALYGHCTRHQNNFVQSGAMTVLMVNNDTQNHTAHLKFGQILLKTTEVQSYILTSPSEDSTDVYLNGDRLNFKAAERLAPKLRVARVTNYLSLSLPAKSIGFFVLPAAKVPICITNEESELGLVMDEISKDQKMRSPFDGVLTASHDELEVTTRLGNKKSDNKQRPSLRQLQKMMEEELESDERHYDRVKKRNRHSLDSNHNHKVPHFDFNAKKDDEMFGQLKDELKEQSRNFFIDRAKLADKQRKQVDADHKSLLHGMLHKPHHHEKNSIYSHPHNNFHPHVQPKKQEFELELSPAEIRKILTDRAKAKAAKKNIVFTSRELSEIMDKATKKFLKNPNTSIKITRKTKREADRNKKDINLRLLKLKTLGDRVHHPILSTPPAKRTVHSYNFGNRKRAKRDINMDLLKLKAELHDDNKNVWFENRNGEEESKQKDKLSVMPEGDVYAEIAESDSNKEDSHNKLAFPIKNKLNHHQFKHKLISEPLIIKPALARNFPNKKHGSKAVTEVATDVPLGADNGRDYEFYDDTEDDFYNREKNDKGSNDNVDEGIHEFAAVLPRFGQDEASEQKVYEMWETVDEADDKGTRKNVKETDLTSRGFSNTDTELEYKDDLSLDKDYGELDFSDEKLSKLKRSDPESSNERYKSLTEGLNTWKPSDIINLSKNYNMMYRRSRSVDDNTITNSEQDRNEIVKYKPTGENDEDNSTPQYELIFPLNDDKIHVSLGMGTAKNDEGGIEADLKLSVTHDDAIETEITFSNTTDLILNNAEPQEEKHKLCQPRQHLVVRNEKRDGTDGKIMQSHVQKIQRVREPSGDVVWNILVERVGEFFQGIAKGLKSYFMN